MSSSNVEIANRATIAVNMLQLCFVFSSITIASMALGQDAGKIAPAIIDDASTVQQSHALAVTETDSMVTLSRGERPILVYNKRSPPVQTGIDPVYARSGFLHPVFTPSGKVTTATFPVDHPHQHGIFSAWVKTNYDGREIDFWNLAGRTGRVLHAKVLATLNTSTTCGFEVQLLHQTVQTPIVDVLSETWRVTASQTDGSYHCFDIQTDQVALTDKPLLLEKYHYGGMALRGPVEWLKEKKVLGLDGKPIQLAPSGFLNDLASDATSGNHQHARWVSLFGDIDGNTVSITVMSHPENFRSPQAARLHPSKPYFCFAPCVDGEFVIDKQHPYKATYRYLVTDAAPNVDWIEHQWQEWCGK